MGWGDVIGAGVGLVGGLLGLKGQGDTNAANIQQARETNVANAAEAAKNRDFQEKMSNTSYQRAVQDMKAAGLNPALAYQQGGASAPAGNTAQNIPAQIGNKLGAGVSGAAAAAQTFQNMRQVAANIQNTTAETIKTAKEADAQDIQNNINSAIWEYEYRRAAQDPNNKGQITPYKMYLDRQLQHAQLQGLTNSAAATAAETSLTGTKQQMLKLDMERAKREAEMYKSSAGKFIPFLTPAGQAAKTLRDFTSF